MGQNSGIIFESSDFLNSWVEKRLNFILIEILFTIFLFTVFFLRMLSKNNNMSWFAFGVIGLLIFTSIFIVNSVKKGILINKLVNKASVKDDFIELRTFSFKIYNLIFIDSKIIKLNRKDFLSYRDDFPLKDKGKISSKSFVIKKGEFHCYVMIDYFDINFLKILQQD